MREKFQTPLKALLLIGLALFFYSRLSNGTLYFYINQRFVGFTLVAVIGLLIIGLSYHLGGNANEQHDHAHTHEVAHEHTHEHNHAHSHGLSWGGVLLVLLPIILGLLVPPRPLGASALANREVNLSQSSMPGVIGLATTKSGKDKNILDWWKVFRSSANSNNDHQIIGQTAQVSGFVFKDKKYGPDYFMVTRFVISCCVADASVLGLVVKSPAASKLENDQWVEVKGAFAPSSLEMWKMPIVNAASITPIAIPQQPYLYP
jgi:uncharacterized repeat protein (TIGR03943 family)